VTFPKFADVRVWARPEMWEPGIPIYDRALYRGWQTRTPLFDVKGGDHECQSPFCAGDEEDRWRWIYRPTARQYESIYRLDRTILAVDYGTDFYGAHVAEREEVKP
jgi:hypothetical protein